MEQVLSIFHYTDENKRLEELPKFMYLEISLSWLSCVCVLSHVWLWPQGW